MQRARSVSEDATNCLASRLAGAEFVALRCRADGDALAATGILARALAAIDTPFQAMVRRPGDDRKPATGADLVVRVGFGDPVGRTDRGGSGDATDAGDTISLPGEPTPASLAATRLARELDVDPDPMLALAGGVAASVRDARDPFGDESTGADEGDGAAEGAPDPRSLAALRDRARENGRLGDPISGIALPTADVVAGLAHTTLAHAAFSGDPETTRERCGSLAERENGREVASLLACSVVDTEGAAPRAAQVVERALRPTSLPDSTPFATLEGYADVLEAVATERPGIGIALACGYDVGEAALSAWHAHARRAHAALRVATVSRYDGLSVARLTDGSSGAIDSGPDPDDADQRPDGSDGPTGSVDPVGSDGSDESDAGDAARPPVATIARLCRDFRSPEPVALVVGNGIGAIAATDDRALGTVAARAARELDGTGGGTERLGESRFDGGPDEFVTAVRTALAELADDARNDRKNRDDRDDDDRRSPRRTDGERP